MKTNLIATILLVASTALCLSAHGALRLPAVISDHAMIQAGKPVTIWGWATAGEKVSASFIVADGKSERALAKAGADGRWSAQLPAVVPGT